MIYSVLTSIRFNNMNRPNNWHLLLICLSSLHNTGKLHQQILPDTNRNDMNWWYIAQRFASFPIYVCAFRLARNPTIIELTFPSTLFQRRSSNVNWESNLHYPEKHTAFAKRRRIVLFWLVFGNSNCTARRMNLGRVACGFSLSQLQTHFSAPFSAT